MTAFGIEQALQTRIRAAGWTTYAGYDFSTSYTPGQSDDAAFVTGVLIPILGAADHPAANKLRRLLFEAYTLAVQDLRSNMDRTADTGPRKVPQP